MPALCGIEDYQTEDLTIEYDPHNAGRQDPELIKAEEALRQVRQELETCQKEISEKDKLIAGLRDELKHLKESDLLTEKEAKLERLAADMEKAQQMATMGSWVLEVDTGEVTWTPELHRMFGQDPSRPVPSLKEQENWYTERSWNAMIEAVSRTSKDGSPYNIELETIRRDGSIGIVRSIGEAEKDRTGRIVRLRGIAQDITEIKEAEARLKHALDQEKAAKIYKDQFLANMTHEIRTPMNGVVGFASLLRDDTLDKETKNDYINTIEKCSNQLLNLIDDIIELAKIEAGEIKIIKKPFNIKKLVHDTATLLEATRRQKGKEDIRLTVHIPPKAEDLYLESDSLRLQQILTNLLNNAFKFSHEGTIEFGFEVADDTVVFFVKDEGIGIEPERAELIFERFEHLEGTKNKYEGTGLGLSISKGLAKLLGASLTVESELNVGSTFRLALPESPVKASETEKVPDTTESEVNEIPPSTVLIVEDEQVNQKFIERVLEPTPLRLLLASNGMEAIQYYRTNPDIELVLMDIRMPIMNGDAAAEQILKIDKQAKIIAQTAYAMREDQARLLNAGFVDCITKPYRPESLLQLMRKWL